MTGDLSRATFSSLKAIKQQHPHGFPGLKRYEDSIPAAICAFNPVHLARGQQVTKSTVVGKVESAGKSR